MVLVDMVGQGRKAAGMDVGVAAGEENQRYTPRTNGSAKSAALETCEVVWTAGTVRVSRTILRIAPQASIQEKIAVLEKTVAGMGNDEPILVGKRVLEQELERHQKKLNGAKNTAKHIEATQKLGQQRVQTHRGRERETRKSRFSEQTCCERENRWTKTGA